MTDAIDGLPVGGLAPDFTLRDQNRQEVTLSAFRGRRTVVLVFYPWAFTRVCEGELCRIRDHLADLQGDAVQVLAVSVDSVHAHRAWAEREGFGYPLLADFWPHGAVAKAYGVFDDQIGVAVRGTFVIDSDGVIRWRVVNGIADARDLEQVLQALAGLPAS